MFDHTFYIVDQIVYIYKKVVREVKGQLYRFGVLNRIMTNV